MPERSEVAAFALEIARTSAISAAAGLAVVSMAGPVRHVILAQAEPSVAIVAVLAVGALVGASVAVVAGSCPAQRTKGE